MTRTMTGNRKAALLMAAAALTGTAASAAADTISYRYDARGRLVLVERNRGGAAPVVTTHSYDKANNRTNKAVSGAP
jgi:YD repeat-containing protein